MKKIWSYLSIPAAALAVLTGSIAWVLLLRPFYYVQIGPLGVCQASGLTAAQARAAYSDVMDYCLGLRPDFAASLRRPAPGPGSCETPVLRTRWRGGRCTR